jgi:hypothetical protein
MVIVIKLLTLLVCLSATMTIAFRFRAMRAGKDIRISRSTFVRLQAVTVIPSDEEMESWLDGMVYSGDMEGYLIRQQGKLVSEDFIDYVDERCEQAEDEDEKGAYSEVLQMLNKRRAETDGSVDSGVAYEQRLDQILFTAPNKRYDLIQGEICDEITPGFIRYIQDELKEVDDSDAKVVYASILKLIGDAQGGDVLGSSVSFLSKADSSLGDDFASGHGSGLLTSGEGVNEAKGSKTAIGDDRNEQILAGLTFSTNDLLEDVLNNLHEIDSRFTDFLEDKIDKARDFDEKSALSSLYDTVKYVLDKVAAVQGEGEGVAMEEELSIDQMRERMKEIQSGSANEDGGTGEAGSGGISSADFQVMKSADSTFRSILERFEGIFDDEQLIEAVQKNYELCDLNFMEMLAQEVKVCKTEGADMEAQQLENVLSTIKTEMTDRVASAQQKLEDILAKNALGGIRAMESECVRLVRKGLADEALILLIEANQQQAASAGSPAAQVLQVLLDRIVNEKQKDLPDEQRLLRALMKESAPEKRREILFEAFKPQKSMDNDGVMTEGAPLISPPLFINVAKSFMQNFGNVEDFDILGKVQPIIDDAETVATELYGKGMTPRDQQQFMYEKQTMSVWDLENFEQMAQISGEEIPWANDKYDGMDPQDVAGQRVKKVGGSE